MFILFFFNFLFKIFWRFLFSLISNFFFQMMRTRKQTNSPRGRTNSPRGRTHLGAASPPVTRSPIRGAGQAGNVFGPFADDFAADETDSPPHRAR